MSELYDKDIVAWAEQQASLLRRRASNEVDWDHLADEIAEIGVGALERVEGLLYQALLHRLKLMCWPQARDVQKWQHDYLNLLGQARLHHRAAWDRRIDVQRIWKTVRRHLPEKMYGALPTTPPEQCPWTVEQLLHDEPPPP